MKKTLRKPKSRLKKEVQDELYWVKRPRDDKIRDWLYSEPDWILDYWKSREHPHRQLILDALKKVDWGYLLEIGCNCGPNLGLIRENYPDKALAGIDANAEVIEEAKKHLDQAVDLRVGSITQLPWPDGYFDVVLVDAVLIYVDPKKIDRVLAEISRVARKAVILVERDDKSLKGKAVFGYWNRDYKTLLEGFGFIVEKTKLTQDQWPMSKGWQKFGYLYLGRR